MHMLISLLGTRPDWYALLRHEATAAGVQVSNDEIESVMANYTRDLQPDTDPDLATRAGVTGLLKIISRYEQVAGMAKISKPQADQELVAEAENLQLDLLQFNAADYVSKVPPPTTQQLQDQFTQFAAVTPHQPNPTTNPFGFGYRLPLRAKLQFVRLSPDAVNAATVATKSAYDWEVQARKYYLAHLDKYPATAPTTTAPVAPIAPLGPQPFKAVQDKILTEIRQPLDTALMDQVQRLIDSTPRTDWQAYSQFIASAKPGPEPVSSLGVPYTSFDYLTKLAEKVQSKFNVTITVSQTPDDLSQEQIAALPGIGDATLKSATLSQVAMTQASNYLSLTDKKDPSAPAQLAEPSPLLQGSDFTSVVIYRLSEVLPSEPAPSLQTVAAQVDADLRTAAAYKLAEDQARDIVTNIRNRPLFVAATANTPVIHLDHLSVQSYDLPEIKPPLGDSLRSFTTQAFGLLGAYDPALNRNPAQVIALPEQGRIFATQLSSVDADWNSENLFFDHAVQVHHQFLNGQQNFVREVWFDYEAVMKRTGFKPLKNSGG